MIDVDDLNEHVFKRFDRFNGEEAYERIESQVKDYKYYHGYQHLNPNTKELVKPEDLPRPEGFDYDPTRISTNYFKTLIDRKARWQMGGDHVLQVERKQVDSKEERLEPDYEPSEEQLKENERAEGLEEVFNQLWEENKMKERLLAAARDRLLAGRVVCKIAWNSNKGKLHWIFRPDYEYIPIYSEDDFEELIGAVFLIPRTEVVDDELEDAVLVQVFSLEGEEGQEQTCYIEEDLYLLDGMEHIRTELPKTSMELDFIPVVEFPIETLSAGNVENIETESIKALNGILNQLNEDAIDSIKFEMFPITTFIDVPEGTVNKIQIAPGAVFEVQGQADGLRPTIEKVESKFTWKEALKEQYNRIKSSMHEITGLPQVVPQEMNIGGLNDEAMRILFQDIIADTEEHWLSWSYGLKELHEKSIKYLQARIAEPNFSYDKDLIRGIEEFETDIVFALPLPDNRRERVQLLAEEVNNNFESQKGAMERLGVQDVSAKIMEIEQEMLREKQLDDPYGDMAGGDNVDISISNKERSSSGLERVNENGEVEEICPNCGGSGVDISDVTGEEITCSTCKGTGWHQPRKR